MEKSWRFQLDTDLLIFPHYRKTQGKGYKSNKVKNLSEFSGFQPPHYGDCIEVSNVNVQQAWCLKRLSNKSLPSSFPASLAAVEVTLTTCSRAWIQPDVEMSTLKSSWPPCLCWLVDHWRTKCPGYSNYTMSTETASSADLILRRLPSRLGLGIS